MENEIKNYRDLIVWQKSMEVTEKIYALTRNFPREEIYGLTSQIRRAAISIPSNIAEGRSRSSKEDFRRFLYISYGSVSEVETQLELSVRLGFCSQTDAQLIFSTLTSIAKMLRSLIAKL